MSNDLEMQTIDGAQLTGGKKRRKGWLFRVYYFYSDGIRSMTVGRTLWILVAVKLFIMFAILRVFFFPRHMGHLETENDKAEYVIEQLSNPRQ